jgi:hypothetical protein
VAEQAVSGGCEVQSSTVIDDYAETAGQGLRNMTPSTAPTPATAKAAKTIIAAVESDEPPAFLQLCNDALRTHRRLAAARLDTIQTTWEDLTTTTDIDI